MSYLGNQPVPHSTRTIQEFTVPSGGQTTFATAGYVPNFIQVTLNGVRLAATDYTATNGSDVVLTTAAVEGDVLCVDMQNELVDVGAGFASTSEVTGTNTTGSITTGTNSLTVASGTGINVGDYLVGEGIAPNTTVSAISGTSVTLSGTVGATLTSDPVSFYTANKALSPGTVAGALCRAWVNFYGSGTAGIRAAYNVSSITDLGGIAKYSINFTTAMPDTYYSWVASAGFNNFAQQLWVSSPSSVALATWKTTTQIQLQAVYANNTVNADPAEFNVTIFR